MTYAVRWREGGGEETYAGRLMLLRDELELTGTAFDGSVARHAVAYGKVHELYLDRSARGPTGRPSLVLVTDAGARLAIESLESLGVLHELADRVAGARHEVAA